MVMIRAFVFLLMVAALVAPGSGHATCPPINPSSSQEVVRFFNAVTLAVRQAQIGGYEAYETFNQSAASTPTPFEAVLALRSELSRLECANSLVSPFQHSANTSIATDAQLMVMSLKILHWATQRMLQRVNATLAGKPLPQVQSVNDSAADALKQQDAMSNLALSATMSAMLVRACDPGAGACNRLLLTPEQRKELTPEWLAMAAPEHGDKIAEAARAIAKMLKDPNFKSLPASGTSASGS